MAAGAATRFLSFCRHFLIHHRAIAVLIALGSPVKELLLASIAIAHIFGVGRPLTSRGGIGTERGIYAHLCRFSD
jgi:hypothetical protein